MQGIKTRLTVIVAGLLIIGMLLINLVMITLWHQYALRQEIHSARAVLDAADHFSASVATTCSTLDKDTTCIFVQPGTDRFSFASPPVSKGLAEVVFEAVEKDKEIVTVTGSVWGAESVHGKMLLIAHPVVTEDRNGKNYGGVGLAKSLAPMYEELWRSEKIVLVYLLVNVIVLSVVGFFRMRRLVVDPIDRLVGLADQYRDEDGVLFVAGSTGNEFGRLSASLNTMMSRIENDRAALKASVDQLEHVNRKLKTQQQEMVRTEKLASVGRMAAGLAHEIGNPLGVVQGYLGLLEGAAGQSDKHREYIRRADQELLRVNELIRQMLDFARVSKGEPENGSLHALLRSVVDMIQVQPVFAGIQLICTLDASMDIVFADQDRLRQVFVNCLLNSADAVTAAGCEGEGRITVSTDLYEPMSENDQKDFIRIRISDNGIGIAEDDLAVIFDPFYTTKEPGKGTGLGLSVSLAIIESMGGKMEMESKEGEGCVLSVFLPITGEDDV